MVYSLPVASRFPEGEASVIDAPSIGALPHPFRKQEG